MDGGCGTGVDVYGVVPDGGLELPDLGRWNNPRLSSWYLEAIFAALDDSACKDDI